MALTKNKVATAAKTLREAVESGEFPNSATRAMNVAAAALEDHAGVENDEE